MSDIVYRDPEAGSNEVIEQIKLLLTYFHIKGIKVQSQKISILPSLENPKKAVGEVVSLRDDGTKVIDTLEIPLSKENGVSDYKDGSLMGSMYPDFEEVLANAE